MRTEAQREASRANGAKSRGPKSPEGKAVTKFNGLKHGLRAEQVVLPGEDPAAFEAEKQAWFDDWRPATHTRAVLVERAAIASWKLRRAVGAESAMRSQRADEAAREFDVERLARVDRAVARFDDDPAGALTLIESGAVGLDPPAPRLLLRAGGRPGARPRRMGPARVPRAADAPARPPLRRRARVGRAGARRLGPPARRQRRARGIVGGRGRRPDDGGRGRGGGRGPRAGPSPGRSTGYGRLRQRAPDPEAPRAGPSRPRTPISRRRPLLRHRYEMAHERLAPRPRSSSSLALDRSKQADLAPPIEADPGPAEASAPQPESQAPDPATGDPATQAPEPSASGSVGAREPGSIPTPDAAPGRAPTPPSRGAAAAVGAAHPLEIHPHESHRRAPTHDRARSARRGAAGLRHPAEPRPVGGWHGHVLVAMSSERAGAPAMATRTWPCHPARITASGSLRQLAVSSSRSGSTSCPDGIKPQHQSEERRDPLNHEDHQAQERVDFQQTERGRYPGDGEQGRSKAKLGTSQWSFPVGRLRHRDFDSNRLTPRSCSQSTRRIIPISTSDRTSGLVSPLSMGRTPRGAGAVPRARRQAFMIPGLRNPG